jgi:uncharacterized protein (TIGR02246 family)
MKARTCAVFALAMLCVAAAGAAVNGAQQRGGAETAIRAVLDAQVEAWNRGDLEGFVAGYWKSEQLTFVTSRGVTRGWQGLLERYKRSYPDAKAMGRLSFNELEITVLSRDAAVVLGRWQLGREKDQPQGHFTLLMRKVDGAWRVAHDHTTSFASP